VTDHSTHNTTASTSKSSSLPTFKSAPVASKSSHTPVLTVADPHPAAAPISTSPQQTIVTDRSTNTGEDHGWRRQYCASIANGAMTTPATRTSIGLADRSSALLSQIEEWLTERGGSNTVSAPITAADARQANDSPAPFLASHRFALLNQYLAGNTCRVDPGQIVAGTSYLGTWAHDSILTRPQP
jgi:hypothetical protein